MIRRTLLTLACFSTLAMAQTVLAIAPAGDSVRGVSVFGIEMTARGSDQTSGSEVLPGDDPARGQGPGSLGLLAAGLIGLMIAGGRHSPRRVSGDAES